MNDFSDTFDYVSTMIPHNSIILNNDQLTVTIQTRYYDTDDVQRAVIIYNKTNKMLYISYDVECSHKSPVEYEQDGSYGNLYHGDSNYIDWLETSWGNVTVSGDNKVTLSVKSFVIRVWP